MQGPVLCPRAPDGICEGSASFDWSTCNFGFVRTKDNTAACGYGSICVRPVHKHCLLFFFVVHTTHNTFATGTAVSIISFCFPWGSGSATANMLSMERAMECADWLAPFASPFNRQAE